MSYTSINLITYTSGSNTIDLLNRDDEKSLNQNININTGVINQQNGVNGMTLYLYNIKMKIESHGVFNTVNRIEMVVKYHNSTIENPTYVWTIVYDFSGSKTVNSIIEMYNPPFNGSNSIQISIEVTIFSGGLLAQPIKSITFDRTVTN